MNKFLQYCQKELRSFQHAFNGFKHLSRDHNFYFHFPVGLLVMGMAALFQVEKADWLWLISSIAAVWIAEGFNTAIEKLTDLAQPAHHPMAGQVKDIAAAVVVMAVCYAAIVGMTVMWPYFRYWALYFWG